MKITVAKPYGVHPVILIISAGEVLLEPLILIFKNVTKISSELMKINVAKPYGVHAVIFIISAKALTTRTSNTI